MSNSLINASHHWIDDNRDAVQQEFGAGQAATPNNAFAKAATAYDSISKQL